MITNIYKPTVLIVDDEKINIDYIVENFKNEFNFKVTTNSKNVFKILSKTNIDLILLDIKMPELSGFDIAKQLKKDVNFKNIPFIFLTSKTDTESIVEGFELGAVDYMTKPFNLKELQARINTHAKNFILQEKVKQQQIELLSQSKFAAMGEMITMIAHQWRQPLNIIALITQELDLDRSMHMFSDEEYSKKKNQLLTTITDLSKTIENFSKYLKKDRPKDSSNVVETLNELYEIYKDQFDEANIDFKIENKTSTNNIVLNISKDELLKVFSNFIQNSIEAIQSKHSIEQSSEQNYIKVELSIDNNFININFTDNGIAIDDKIKNTIFEPYVTSKNDLNGVGLGLYISKMIIENYLKGSISFSNKENSKTFTVKIKKED